jgi:hypothetical protein
LRKCIVCSAECEKSFGDAGDGADALNCDCTRNESICLLPLDHCSLSSIGSFCETLEGAVGARGYQASPCEGDQYHALSWCPLMIFWRTTQLILSGSRMQDFGFFPIVHHSSKLPPTVLW